MRLQKDGSSDGTMLEDSTLTRLRERFRGLIALTVDAEGVGNEGVGAATAAGAGGEGHAFSSMSFDGGE